MSQALSRSELEEAIRTMMRRLASRGRIGVHTVWEHRPKEKIDGFLIYRVHGQTMSTPAVLWLDDDNGQMKISITYLSSGGRFTVDSVYLDKFDLEEVEHKFEHALAL